MFISVIFNTEFFDVESRLMWYLKNLNVALEEGWCIITHETLYRNFLSLQNKCAARFLNEFEMRYLTSDEFNSIEQYIVPDEIFDKLEEKYGTRSNMLMNVVMNREEELENYLQGCIKQIFEKHPEEKLEGIFVSQEAFESVRQIGNQYKVPVIPYSFSAIRKVHGYKETLFLAQMDGNLYCSDEVKKTYESYRKEEHEEICTDNRDILVLFGKECNFPLLKVLESEPTHEIGLCTSAFTATPHHLAKYHYTDDDLYYECHKKYPQDMIRVRQHPVQMDWAGNSRAMMKNDPATFVLSCRRIATISSQIIIKAMLWGRTACAVRDVLPFAFACEKKLDATETVSKELLNYLIFVYLIPMKYMFSSEYWRWRKSEPAQEEIAKKHLRYYGEMFGIEENIFYEKDREKRFAKILKCRNCDENITRILMENTPVRFDDYDKLVSKLVTLTKDGNQKVYYTLNKVQNKKVVSRFIVSDKEAKKMVFFPFPDVAGLSRLNECSIDGELLCECKPENAVTVAGMNYLKKMIGGYSIVNRSELKEGQHEVYIKWEYAKSMEEME